MKVLFTDKKKKHSELFIFFFWGVDLLEEVKKSSSIKVRFGASLLHFLLLGCGFTVLI
jgi:hypothetical protein